MNQKRILFLGGDARQEYMAGFFKQEGFQVEKNKKPKKQDIIILPVPVTDKDGNILGSEMDIKELCSLIDESHIIFGGKFPEEILTYAKHHHVQLVDLMKDKTVTEKNSVPTAEGAVAEALLRSPGIMKGSLVLVTGYGVCAKEIAHLSASIGAKVTVAARRLAQRELAAAAGFSVISIDQIKEWIKQADIVFNTVPAMIFTEQILEKVQKDTVFIDIASGGGMDFAYCKKHQITANLYPGIPGKIAPREAGKILFDAVMEKIVGK